MAAATCLPIAAAASAVVMTDGSPVGQAAHDITGDLVADMADDHGDGQARYRGRPRTGRKRRQSAQPAPRPRTARPARSAGASTTRAAELMRLPTVSLYRATTTLPTMPMMAPAMPAARCVVGPCRGHQSRRPAPRPAGRRPLAATPCQEGRDPSG